MVDATKFQLLRSEENEQNYSKGLSSKISHIIIPVFIVISGAIFSGGRLEIILISTLVGVVARLVLVNTSSNIRLSSDPFVKESHFKELEYMVYQMNKEIEELKGKKY